jgi:hypothetical protein
MIQLTLLFVGSLAFIATYIASSTPEPDRSTLYSVLGLFSWGLFSLGSLNVEVVTNDTITAIAYPPLALLGACFGVVCIYLALTEPIELMNPEKAAEADNWSIRGRRY